MAPTTAPSSAAERIRVERPSGQSSSALWLAPADAIASYVLGHGAGAGMEHPHLERLAQRFSEQGIATLRYQFPYMQEQRPRPDPPRRLRATVRAAVATAHRLHPDLPLFVGGRSMGGRVAGETHVEQPLRHVTGFVFLAFPLHRPTRKADPDPETPRAAALQAIDLPMLFHQGTRDALTRLPLLQSVLDDLSVPVHLHVVDGADHSFRVLKSIGTSLEEVEVEIAVVTARWMREVCELA